MADDVVASLTWTIERFDQIPSRILYYCSPYFKARSMQFLLRFNILKEGDSRYLSILLTRCQGSGFLNPVHVTYRISLLGATGLRHFEKTYGEDNSAIHRSEVFDKFINMDEVLVKHRSTLLPNNRLTIHVDILRLTIEELDAQGQEVELLSQDLAKLLESGAFSDMEIESSDGETFRVHKFLLECRCPDFLRSLERKEGEKRWITDVEGSNLRMMLKYVYTGSYEATEKNFEFLRRLEKEFDFEFEESLLTCSSEKIRMLSNLPTTKVSFSWSVKDLSGLQKGKDIKYPIYLLTRNKSDRLEVALSPKGKTEFLTSKPYEDDCQFVPSSSEIEIVFFKALKSDIRNICGYIAIKQQTTVLVRINFEFWNYEDRVCKMQVIEIPGQRILSDLGSIDLVFDLTIVKEDLETAYESIEAVGGPETSVVANNFKGLTESLKCSCPWFDPKENSIILRAGKSFFSNTQDFYVEKGILSVRSPVFAEMFKEIDLEKKEGQRFVFTIRNMTETTLRSLMEYIYSASIHEGFLGFQETMALYAAADRYGILSLKNRCLEFIRKSVHESTVGIAWAFARAHHDEAVQELVEAFVSQNPKALLECEQTDPKDYSELFEETAEEYSWEEEDSRDAEEE